MLDKLAQIEARYEELTNELSSPELLSNPSAYGKAAKQHRSLGEVLAETADYGAAAAHLEKALATTDIEGYRRDVQGRLAELKEKLRR